MSKKENMNNNMFMELVLHSKNWIIIRKTIKIIMEETLLFK